MISDAHALRGFFTELVTQHFTAGVGIRDQELAGYVSNMLTKLGMQRRSQAAAYAARLGDRILPGP